MIKQPYVFKDIITEVLGLVVLQFKLKHPKLLDGNYIIQGYACIHFEDHDILPVLSVILPTLEIRVFFEYNLILGKEALLWFNDIEGLKGVQA